MGMGTSSLAPYVRRRRPAAFAGGLIAVALLVCSWPHRAVHANEGLVGAEVKAQIATEIGLRLNERYLHTLNPAISNYGDDLERQIYRRAIFRHIRSEILYRALHFNEAYRELQKSQLLLIQLYTRVIERSQDRVDQRLIVYSRRILNEPFPPRIRKYLELGLRDLAVSRRLVTMQANRYPLLFQVRLTELEEALKLTRQASRFWVLISLELDSVARSNDPDHINYAEARGLILSGYQERRGDMLLLHEDNHFKIGPESRDQLALNWNDPDFSTLENPIAGWIERPEDTLSVAPAVGTPAHYAPRRVPED